MVYYLQLLNIDVYKICNFSSLKGVDVCIMINCLSALVFLLKRIEIHISSLDSLTLKLKQTIRLGSTKTIKDKRNRKNGVLQQLPFPKHSVP